MRVMIAMQTAGVIKPRLNSDKCERLQFLPSTFAQHSEKFSQTFVSALHRLSIVAPRLHLVDRPVHKESLAGHQKSLAAYEERIPG
jgi:hypothetical protein